MLMQFDKSHQWSFFTPFNCTFFFSWHSLGCCRSTTALDKWLSCFSHWWADTRLWPSLILNPNSSWLPYRNTRSVIPSINYLHLLRLVKAFRLMFNNKSCANLKNCIDLIFLHSKFSAQYRKWFDKILCTGTCVYNKFALLKFVHGKQ